MADVSFPINSGQVAKLKDLGDGSFCAASAPLAKYSVTLPTITDGLFSQLQVGSRGSLNVQLMGAEVATAITTGNFSADAVSGSGLNSKVDVRSFLYLFNGASADRVTKSNATTRLLTAAATTNATSVKASAGNVHKIRGENVNAAKRYLKLYNKASAPTVGTDTPILTFVLSAAAQFDIDLGTLGHYFSTGIAYALTTAAADADVGALTAGDVQCMNITYS